MKKSALVKVFITVWILAMASIAMAEDPPAEGVVEKPHAIYVPLKPSFVVNYGGAGRLRYLKADLSARVNNTKAAEAVMHHLPFIRNNLVRLFASQTDETLESQEGKEALRQEVLKEIISILKAEADVDGVEDVFFNNLIIQK